MCASHSFASQTSFCCGFKLRHITINGAGWSISDAFPAFLVECGGTPSPRGDKSA
jgi:hypothetical protein